MRRGASFRRGRQNIRYRGGRTSRKEEGGGPVSLTSLSRQRTSTTRTLDQGLITEERFPSERSRPSSSSFIFTKFFDLDGFPIPETFPGSGPFSPDLSRFEPFGRGEKARFPINPRESGPRFLVQSKRREPNLSKTFGATKTRKKKITRVYTACVFICG